MSKPKKVYVLTHGDYSDAVVVGVFSSREAVDAYTGPATVGYGSDFSVDEFLLDDPALARLTHRPLYQTNLPLGGTGRGRDGVRYETLDRNALAAGRWVGADEKELPGETWVNTVGGGLLYRASGVVASSFHSPEAARTAAEEFRRLWSAGQLLDPDDSPLPLPGH